MTRTTTKKAMGAAALALGALLALAPVASAQAGWGHGFGGPRHRTGRGFGAGFPGLHQLNLTDAQRDQVRAIMQQHRGELRTLGQKLRAAHRAQQEAVTATPLDEGQVRSRAAAVAELQTEMAVLRARIHNEIFQVLTPEQQAKAQQLRAERAKRMEERRQRMEQRMKERRQRQQGPTPGAAQPGQPVPQQ